MYKALRWYLIVFVVLAAMGWGLEIAGRADVGDVSIDHSALFHPEEDFHDRAAFGDLTDVKDRTVRLSAAALHKPGFVAFPYPPAAAFLFKFFNQGFSNGPAAYLCCFGLIAVVAVGLVAMRLGRGQRLALAVLLTTALLGSSQIFCANRGNLELFSGTFAAAGLGLFLGGFGWAAAVAVGLAMCVKPFPALLLLLFLWRRQWAQAALAIAVCVLVSTAALYVLGPSVPAAAKIILTCWADYFNQQVVVLNIVQELKTDHSLMDAVKLVLWRVLGDDFLDVKLTDSDLPVWARLDLWVSFFEVFAVFAAAFVAWFFRRGPVLNQVFALVLLMVLLPFISSEYTLMLLYLPCAVLLVRMSQGGWAGSPRQMATIAVLLALLFAPLNVLGVYAGLAKTVLLLGLFGFVARVPLGDSAEGRHLLKDA
ncbi:Protein of unknown function (DUF2029) [Terriglobus roseus DSM 18391]|uniref:DUF2029 domain-containing protein n=1 Tax=Terriglobus roseus (strain DSM 18391 / NRRL B-41598 / KBS 63) TaxID=926566 RepID=I3ZEZ6_TERRK|nr:glycosyltransferase 87 family protein [Terriglobus roseus]AFL87814.1 Protein of unknown function (DUF2029) [Terriglobus roseus DSM 18391]